MALLEEAKTEPLEVFKLFTFEVKLASASSTSETSEGADGSKAAIKMRATHKESMQLFTGDFTKEALVKLGMDARSPIEFDLKLLREALSGASDNLAVDYGFVGELTSGKATDLCRDKEYRDDYNLALKIEHKIEERWGNHTYTYTFVLSGASLSAEERQAAVNRALRGRIVELEGRLFKLEQMFEEFTTKPDASLETAPIPVASFEASTHFVRGTYGGGYGYSGSKDALCVSFSKDVFLCGVGIWKPPESCRATVRIFDGDNGSGKTAVKAFAEQTFTGRKNTTPEPYIFEEPFEMRGGRKYTVELEQRNTGGHSYRTKTDVRTSIAHGGITLTITKAVTSPNGTSPSDGALPCFYAYFE